MKSRHQGHRRWPTAASGASSGPTPCRCCRPSASRSQKEKPLGGVRISACLHVTTETANLMRDAARPAAPQCVAVRLQPAVAPRTTWPRALVRGLGIPVFAITARTTTPTTSTSMRSLDLEPADHHGRRRRPGLDAALQAAQDLARRMCSAAPRRRPPASSGCAPWHKEGVLKFPDRGRQRRADQAHLRQPLRHRAEHDRRHPPRDQRAARPASTFVVAGYGWCGRGLAMRARGMGANVDRHGGRSGQGARGRDGRLPRDARDGRGRDRRRVRAR